MCAIKAYLDDSGSPDDPTNSFVTIAGYVADEYSWECFEKSWANALEEAGIPYLHMREFGNLDSPIYKHLREDKRRHMNFMLDAVAAIADNLDLCVHSTVNLVDLEAFNDRHNLNLDPLAIALYGCIRRLRWAYANEPLEIVLDRFDRSLSRAETALDYARTETFSDLKVDALTPIALQKEESFKTILPLQAADFVAWEVRKSFEDRKGFSYTAADKEKGRRHMNESYLKWMAEHETKTGKPPRERGSYKALRKALGLLPHGVLMDEFNLEQGHKWHPNGWLSEI